jgi:hypothetical protein
MDDSRDISWNEDAVAVMRPRDGDKGNLEVVAQGSLAGVLDAIAAGFASDLARMRISFPERRKPPYRYEGAEIAALLAERGRAAAMLNASVETSGRRARSPSRRG